MRTRRDGCSPPASVRSQRGALSWSSHLRTTSISTVIPSTPSTTGPFVNPASPTASPSMTNTGHVPRPRQIAYTHSRPAVMKSSSTLSVRHALADTSAITLVPRMKTVQNVRAAPTRRHRTIASIASVSGIATADGSRAAKELSPSSFIAAAWHQ
jgi:hypothetical protein